MQKVSIGFVGLSAAASSALIQSVVEQLAPKGVVVIDRDENGADITVLDKGEFFVLPDGDTQTFEGGVPTFECNCTGDLRTDFDELAREWEGKEMADAADLPGLDLRSWEARKAFDGFSEAVKGLHITAPISPLKPRIRAGVTEEPKKDPLEEIRDQVNALLEQVSMLNHVVYGMSEK